MNQETIFEVFRSITSTKMLSVKRREYNIQKVVTYLYGYRKVLYNP